MKRSYTYLKGLLTLALAAFTGWMWAADPVATWTDMSTATSGAYTLNGNGNEISDGVLTINGKPSYISGTVFNPRESGKALVLAMRVTNLDLTKVSALISLKLGNSNNQLGLMTDGEGGMDAMWASNIRGGQNTLSTKLSSTATEYLIVFKYSDWGTQAWAIGNDGVFAQYTSDSSCKGGTNEAGGDIRIGALFGAGYPATGLKIHSMTLWNTNEGIEDVIAACATEEMKTNRAFVENGTGAQYTATVEGNVNLSEIVWTTVADGTTVTTANLPNGAKLKINASNNPVITNDAAFANKFIYTANPLTVKAVITPNQNDYSAIIPGIVSNPSYEIFPAGLFFGPGTVTYTATWNATAGYELVVAGNRATLKTIDSATLGIPSFGVNFYNNDAAKVAGTEAQGAYPIKGAAWTDVQGDSTAAVNSFNLSDAAGNITANTTMSLERTAGARQYGLDNMPSSALLKGYIDDRNDNPTTLTFSHIPYAQYRVIVYMSTDTANSTFAPVSIGGISYASVANNTATATVASSSNWGHTGPNHNANDLAEGVNYLVSPMMTDSSCVISTVRRNGGPRATIAAVQFIDCTAENRTMTLPGQEIALDVNTNISDIDLTATEVLITVKPGVTLTFDEAVTLTSLRVVAEGTAESPVKFDATVANPFANIGSVTLEGTAVELVADIYSDTKPSKTALEVIAIASNTDATAEAPQVVASTIAIASGKTLKTKGYLNFTAANTIASGGMLEVVSGVTTFNLAETGLNGTLKVATGATFKNGTNDGPNYNGAPTFDIAGTLEVTGTARWSLGNTASITLREGAVLNGSGGAGGYNYAYDCFDGATINVLGDATINGNIGAHNGGTITFDIADGKTVTLKGKYDGGSYSGAPKLAVTGSGKLVLENENTYTGGTSIANGSKLVVTHASALGSGNITLDGTLTFKDVEAALSNQITQTDPNNTTNPTGQIVIDNSTVTLNGPNGNYKGVITVNTGAKLKSVTDNYAPFGNGASIVNNGTIDVTNNGAGDCAISAVISGSGSLTLNAGTLILGGANTYRGTTTIAAGAKVIAQTESGATWNFNNVSTEADVTVNGTLDFVSTSEIYRGFAGSAGTINIKGNVILGNTGNSDELSGLSRFEGNLVVDDEKTLTLITWENPYDIALASLELNGAIVGQAKGANASTLSLTTQALSGTGTINIPVTLADGATLAGAVTVNSTVTVAGALNITHADEAGETVITCNNAADILASLPPAPATLKYVADGNTIKLAKAGAFIVGEDVYETFADAFAAAIEGEVAEITIDKNATEDVFETPGFKITKDVTIDLGGKTLRLTPPAVGSAGTETLGIQILNTAETVVIKNGKIDVVGSNLTAAKPIKMMINNYVSQSLMLQAVTLDGTNLVKPENMAAYTLSNNQGFVAILNSTIKAKAGGIAFDACKYASYEAPTVMVDEDSIIEGDVELSGGSVMAAEGAITVVSGLAGYKVVYNGTAYTLEKKGAFEVDGVDYATLAEAYAVGSEIKLIADAEAPAFKIEKALTLDLGGKMLTLTPQGVGSTGTETLGIQIKMATTIKNGTIAVAESNTSYTGPGKPIKMLINNYADLTLKNVTLNGTNLYKEEGKVNYTLSNNCGEVTIDAESAIIANDGGIAFDVCKFGSYDAPTVTVAEGATITGKVEITGGTLTDNTGALNVGTTAGFILNKVGNVYTVTAIVIDDNIDKNGNIPAETKAAIKAAMAQAGVAEISNYTITTKKTGASAEVAEVAAVLEVFDVTPEVAENGVLTVAYEFGISNINNNGDGTVDITAGVDENTEIRAGVEVVFYADNEEIKRATSIDGKTVTIEGINVDTIKGKKITVKAIK